MKRKLLGLGAALVAVAAGFGIWQGQMEVQANRGDHPEYVVDPSWPRALPHQWLIGQVPGIAVDRDDNIWIVQRPRTLTSDERAASNFEPGTPPVLDGRRAAARRARRLLPPGAIGHAIRPERPPAARLGRASGSRVRRGRSRQQVRGAELPVAEHRAWHLRRPPHERLAGRPGRRRGAQVHQGRRLPAADRPAPAPGAQQQRHQRRHQRHAAAGAARGHGG